MRGVASLIVAGLCFVGGCGSPSARQLSIIRGPDQTEFFSQDLQWVRSEKVHIASVCLAKRRIRTNDGAQFHIFIQNRSGLPIIFGPEKIAIANTDGTEQARVLTYEELVKKATDVAGRVSMHYAAAGAPGRSLELMQMMQDSLAKSALKMQTVPPGYSYGGFIEAEIPSFDKSHRRLDMMVTVGDETHVFRISIAADALNNHEGNDVQSEHPHSPSAHRLAPLSSDLSTLVDQPDTDATGLPPHTNDHELDNTIWQERMRCIQLFKDHGMDPGIASMSTQDNAYYQDQYGEKWRQRLLADLRHDREELERYFRDLAAQEAKQRTRGPK